MGVPISSAVVQRAMAALKISDLSQATIREIVALSGRIEEESGVEFIHMEMGVPGLPAAAVGVAAEVEALQKGVASVYPVIDGIPEVKREASRFIKAFVDIDVAQKSCVPVVGSMQGTFTSLLVAGQCDRRRDTILFIDPGFPVQKQQAVVLGYRFESFDVYDFRGDRLREKLNSYLAQGRIACLIYSNPNNPAWFCLNESELQIIGELATQYDVLVLEDLAYFGMDFRKNLGTPFRPPFQASVARYTDNYILLISGSKAFSYAGQRIGIAALSDALYHRSFPGLTERYGVGSTFGSVFIHRALYAISSGTAHSAQCALAAMFRAASDGRFRFLDEVRAYGDRAQRLKAIFLKHGFELVYDCDLDEPLADGFYFTVRYPALSGDALVSALIPFGISALSLSTTGSRQEGIRACTSFIKTHQYDLLDERLAAFARHFSQTHFPLPDTL
jgi:aspartate/methionine/tyrosine aminotransferase